MTFDWVTMVIVILAAALVGLGLGIFRLYRAKKSFVAYLQALTAGHAVERHAPVNFFGQESLGVGQVRGIGHLFLTRDELLFARFAPRKTWRVPRNAVTGAERVSSHLGKTMGKPLFKLHFINEAGVADSIAWLVEDVDGWIALVEGQTG